MNQRDRVLTAIKHDLPDGIPGHLLNIDDVRPYLEFFGFQTRQELLDHFQIGIRRVRPDYKKPVNEPWAKYMLFDDLKPISFFGTSGGSTVYDEVIEHRVFHDAEDVSEIDAYNWPDSTDDWDFDVVPAIIDDYGGRYATMIGAWNPVWCQVYDFFSMEKTLENIHLRPALIEAAIAHIEAFYLQFYNAYFEAAKGKADIFCMGDDFADQRMMMLSPDHWRHFLKPTYKKIFTLAKDYGFYVWFHSCGNISEVLPDLVDIGMDIWETVQCHIPAIEPAKIKKQYGNDITFFGGINTQHILPVCNAAEVRKHVRQRISVLGKGGGYICGPDHHVNPLIPIRNIEAMFDELNHFRGDGYTR